MGKPNVFKIIFDDMNRVYQPGQCVSGLVELHMTKELKTEAITLTVFGGADVLWVEQNVISSYDGNATTVQTYPVAYRNSEVYISETVTLWHGDGVEVLPAEQYTFPFSVVLPDACMPSFQGGMGCIHYYCKARIQRSGRYDHKVKEMFTVLPIHNLNSNPSAGAGMSVEESQPVSLWCCADGTVSYQMNVQKSGYVPGECISATVSIDNQSRHQMQAVEFHLLQVVNYMSTEGNVGHFAKKSESRTIFKTTETLEGMSAPSKYSITKDIVLPPVVATIDANVIQIQYMLGCRLISAATTSKHNIQLPIIVGTVPLRPTASSSLMYRAQNGNYDRDEFQNQPSELFNNLTASAVLPLPHYEECMFGEVDKREDGDNVNTDGNFKFAPKYPVYDI